MNTPSHAHCSVLALLFFAMLVPDSSAQDSATTLGKFIDKKHVLSLGGTRQTMDAKIRATVGDFDPATLTLKDLGLDTDDSSYYAEYRYKLNPQWSFVGGAYRFQESGGRTAERDFNFDGVDYTVGTAIRADLAVEAYIFDAMYTVRRGENYELQVGGGIHALDLSATITATLSAEDRLARESVGGSTLLAPVPNLRFSGAWEPRERLVFNFITGWLSANIDDYEGSFAYAHVRGGYRFTERFGAALGYQYTDVDITQKRSQSELNYDLRLNGVTLTLTYAF